MGKFCTAFSKSLKEKKNTKFKSQKKVLETKLCNDENRNVQLG